MNVQEINERFEVSQTEQQDYTIKFNEEANLSNPADMYDGDDWEVVQAGEYNEVIGYDVFDRHTGKLTHWDNMELVLMYIEQALNEK